MIITPGVDFVVIESQKPNNTPEMIAKSDKDLPNHGFNGLAILISVSHRGSLVRSQVKPVFHSRAIEHVPSIDRRLAL